jgi:hypothetical protein
VGRPAAEPSLFDSIMKADSIEKIPEHAQEKSSADVVNSDLPGPGDGDENKEE